MFRCRKMMKGSYHLYFCFFSEKQRFKKGWSYCCSCCCSYNFNLSVCLISCLFLYLLSYHFRKFSNKICTCFFISSFFTSFLRPYMGEEGGIGMFQSKHWLRTHIPPQAPPLPPSFVLSVPQSPPCCIPLTNSHRTHRVISPNFVSLKYFEEKIYLPE